MKFFIILFTLAAIQIIKSETELERTSSAPTTTATEVAVKNKIALKKEEVQDAGAVSAAKGKPSNAEIKVNDDAVIKAYVSDLNKRQLQQEAFMKKLLEDAAFIKKLLIKTANQNPTWTVIQRRQDGTVDFYRTWNEYKEGFGNRQGEFFIGLDNLHEMTSDGDAQELLIILEDFEGNIRFAKYDKFKVGDEDSKYAITELGDYSGDAGDSLSYHRTRKFSTKDQDNDNNATANCAKEYKGGWWFDNCYSSHLNGPYSKGARSCRGGINWYHWRNYVYSLKFVEMMIRNAQSDDE